MSFTSHILPIGAGVTPTPQTDIDPIYVHSAGDLPASFVGSEGSTDDPQELFPDTFVDMAKEMEEEYSEDEPPKKKKRFFQDSDESDMEEEIL